MKNFELRIQKYIGEGHEAEVYAYERNDKPSGVVVKNYRTDIDAASRSKYEAQYIHLRSRYGDFIPRQRIIPKNDALDSYVLVQQRIEPAERPNLMDYESEELSPKTKQQLLNLIQILREQYKIYQQDKDNIEAYALLDFAKKDNLLVTKDGDIKYVDSGILQEYSRLNPEAAARMIEGPIALLELIAGKSGKEIMNDPGLAGLLLIFKRTGGFYGESDDPRAFEDFIRERYNPKGRLL